MTAAVAHAQLVGGQVTHGGATITETAQSALIQQTTPRAVITWTGFSIPKGYAVTVQQPGASSVLLNRVTGGTPSYLLGSLTANGQVWIVNPAGIITGGGAQLTAAGLLLSTAGISDQNFLAGNAVFDEPGNPGAKVWNGGTITVTGGYAVLAGEQVGNSGVIEARLGSVVLAGAKTYTVDFSGDGLLSFAISAGSSAAGTLVGNKGTIAADGGTVLLTAQAATAVLDNVINTSGIVEATSVATANGKIVLMAGNGGTEVSGTLDASGKGAGETGGAIDVLGNSVTLAAGATLDVSGADGGGTALVGGNFHGAGPEPDAFTTTVAAGAQIIADALGDGTGGNVAVWSNGTTTVAGTITARGGANGGNGGSVETSGETLAVTGVTVDTSAPHGTAGSWLLDPAGDFTICDSGCTLDPGTIISDLGLGNVVIEADLTSGNLVNGTSFAPSTGNITVSDAIDYTSANALSFLAQGNITVSANIVNSGSGNINLIAGWDGITGLSGTTVSVAAFTANPSGYGNAGSVTIESSSVTSAGGTTTFAGSLLTGVGNTITDPTDSFAVTVGGDGALCTPFCPTDGQSPAFERLADGYDPLAPGSPSDSWGISWSGSLTGSADGDPTAGGDSGIISELATYTPHAATVIGNTAAFSVTQHFTFSDANVLHDGVTVVNNTDFTLATLFQRDIDWDVYPTEFDEITTIPGVGTAGPADLGGGIKVSLGNIVSGENETFSYFYAISTVGQSETALGAEVTSAGGNFVVLTDSSDGACSSCGTNSAAIAVGAGLTVTQASFAGFQSPDPAISYGSTTPFGTGVGAGPAGSSAPPSPTTPSTVPLTYLITPPTTPGYVPLPVLDVISSPAPLPSSGGTSGGTAPPVTTLDTGGTLFSSIAPGSGGKPSDPIDDVAPIHPAPQKVPPPPTSDEAIGGAGSALFQSHFTAVQNSGVSGIDTPAPSGGNPSLWYSAEFRPTP